MATVLRGDRLCQPLEVSYLGDEMLQPYHSFEIQWLARLLIAWSQSLNNKVRTKHCTQWQLPIALRKPPSTPTASSTSSSGDANNSSSTTAAGTAIAGTAQAAAFSYRTSDELYAACLNTDSDEELVQLLELLPHDERPSPALIAARRQARQWAAAREHSWQAQWRLQKLSCSSHTAAAAVVHHQLAFDSSSQENP
eukprot:5622-Heterococcus_DN1.PRE.4